VIVHKFDFVYSSLAFHYANDWDTLLSGVNRVLKPDGELLFSTHNPKYWKLKPKTGLSYTNERGVTLLQHTAVLPGDVEIVYYNHPSAESIKDSLIHNGFEIEVFEYPKVVNIDEDNEDLMKLKIKNEKTPLFIVVKAVRS